MRKVKYVWDDSGILSNYISDLTTCKIYDVIKYNKNDDWNNDTVTILGDDDIIRTYFIRSGRNIYFVDATTEYRDVVIDGILI